MLILPHAPVVAGAGMKSCCGWKQTRRFLSGNYHMVVSSHEFPIVLQRHDLTSCGTPLVRESFCKHHVRLVHWKHVGLISEANCSLFWGLVTSRECIIQQRFGDVWHSLFAYLKSILFYVCRKCNNFWLSVLTGIMLLSLLIENTTCQENLVHAMEKILKPFSLY